jgi:hypothetical protein
MLINHNELNLQMHLDSLLDLRAFILVIVYTLTLRQHY